MRAVVQRAHGGPDVLAYDDVPEPVPGPGEVLVRVAACALNRLDVLQRQGPPLVPGFELPHIPGMDVAGTVVALGEGGGEGRAGGRRVGDRVLLKPGLECGRCPACRAGEGGACERLLVIGANRPGGYAELCVAPADHAYALPDDVGFEEAATIPTVYSTAWHALVVAGRLQAGETMLVHGSGSGVTIAAIHIAKRRGARVLATGRSQAKLELSMRLGADGVIHLGSEDLVARCRELTGGRGADLAFDHVGPALFEQSIRALRPHGRLVFCGSTSGTRASFELPYAYHFGISLIGAGPTGTGEFAEMLRDHWQAGFEPVVDSTFALGDAGAAQARMESGEAAGKIVLVP